MNGYEKLLDVLARDNAMTYQGRQVAVGLLEYFRNTSILDELNKMLVKLNEVEGHYDLDAEWEVRANYKTWLSEETADMRDILGADNNEAALRMVPTFLRDENMPPLLRYVVSTLRDRNVFAEELDKLHDLLEYFQERGIPASAEERSKHLETQHRKFEALIRTVLFDPDADINDAELVGTFVQI